MERIRLINTTLILILLNHALISQNGISQKREELNQLRREIKIFEDRIKRTQREEKITLELLDSYEKRDNLLRKLISELKAQIKENEQNINHLKKEILKSEEEIRNLKEQYAKYVKALYKRGRTHDFELILTAQSVNQMIIRTVYLKKFSEHRKTVIDSIYARQTNLKKKINDLELILLKRKDLVAEKEKEEANLAKSIREKRELLEKIRKDKQILQAQIERRKKAIRELESVIARLIEEEKKRTRLEEKDKKIEPPKSHENFASLQGRLPWPVDKGKIINRFGMQIHPILKTITLNYGVDIAVPENTIVKAVADGTVSKIFWLPSFENLIILTHDNGYRTVYANLSDIFVSEGEFVKSGQPIGKSSNTVEGSIVHFEIWHQRQQQNPELWLSKK